MAGAFLMGMYMLIVAILTAKFPPNPDAGLTPSSIAALTMIYLEAMSYNISWGPVPWVSTFLFCIFPSQEHFPKGRTQFKCPEGDGLLTLFPPKCRSTLVKSSPLAFVRLV